MVETNKKIIKRLIKGDQCAFEEIYYCYSNKLYYFGLGLLKDPDEATEMVQEVFVTLWEKRERIDAELNFENYLLTMAYNSIRKFFRKRSIRQKALNNLITEGLEIADSTEDLVIYNDFSSLAEHSIEKMPPKRKLVYKLSRQEGMSAKEISAKLGISKRTVEGHVAQALHFRRKEMSRYSIPAILLFYILFS